MPAGHPAFTPCHRLPRPSAHVCRPTPCPPARLRRWRQRRPLWAPRSWPRRPRSAAVAPPPGAPWATRSAAGAAARRKAQEEALGKRRHRWAQAPLDRAHQQARRLRRWCRWSSWSRRCPCRRVLSGACVSRNAAFGFPMSRSQLSLAAPRCLLCLCRAPHACHGCLTLSHLYRNDAGRGRTLPTRWRSATRPLSCAFTGSPPT